MHYQEKMAWWTVVATGVTVLSTVGFLFVPNPAIYTHIVYAFLLWFIAIDSLSWYKRTRKRVVMDERDTHIFSQGEAAASGFVFAVVFVFLVGVLMFGPQASDAVIEFHVPRWTWQLLILAAWIVPDFVRAVTIIGFYRSGE